MYLHGGGGRWEGAVWTTHCQGIIQHTIHVGYKGARDWCQKERLHKLSQFCSFVFDVLELFLSFEVTPNLYRCCCNEMPSMAGQNQDYFYLHFIQKLFSKNSFMQYASSTLDAIQFAQYMLARLL